MRITARNLCILACSCIIVLSSGCSTAPLTGRQQLLLVPSKQMEAMAASTYVDMLKEETLIETGPEVDRIRRVGVKIARAAETGDFAWPRRGSFEWEFRVIQDAETINAWALPGGKVAVYTGILTLTQSDEELATVLGHEIAHAILRHGNERFSQELVAAGGTKAVETAVKDQSEKTQDMILESFGVGTKKGMTLPYSRAHELEADLIGLKLMAAAGYDPNAAVDFWNRMAQLNRGNSVPPLLKTHPSHEQRIEKIQENLPEAIAIFEGTQKLSLRDIGTSSAHSVAAHTH